MTVTNAVSAGSMTIASRPVISHLEFIYTYVGGAFSISQNLGAHFVFPCDYCLLIQQGTNSLRHTRFLPVYTDMWFDEMIATSNSFITSNDISAQLPAYATPYLITLLVQIR